jgi:hypothetical protein
VKRLRVASAVLIGVSLLALTACGGDEPTTTAAPAPVATTASSAPAAADPAAGGSSDKEICEAAKKAGQAMKTAVVDAFKAGAQPSPDAFKKILDDLDQQLTTLAAGAEGDSKVAAALKKISAEAAEAAKAADPVEAAAKSSFEKAGTDLTAACKAVGIDVNF